MSPSPTEAPIEGVDGARYTLLRGRSCFKARAKSFALYIAPILSPQFGSRISYKPMIKNAFIARLAIAILKPQHGFRIEFPYRSRPVG